MKSVNRVTLLGNVTRDPELKSTTGGVPKFLNRTGALHMMEDADVYQSRIGGYYNLLCKAPGWACAVKLADVRTA